MNGRSFRVPPFDLELTGKTQELHQEIFKMLNQSARSGHSHVTSEPVPFPPHPVPGGVPSRGRQTFGARMECLESSSPHPQELNPWVSDF